MIVISDTGPLQYLVSIGLGDYLPGLYGKVHIPPAVMTELEHDLSPLRNWIKRRPEWLCVTKPTRPLPDGSLDLGEREALALAIELRADLILMDEMAGRQAAQHLGLAVAGTLAVIIDGHKKGLFDGVLALDRLASSTFYASPELMQAVRYRLLN
jgi:predicted nucleic acid-binding protein